jgi:hypothetical protein
MSKTGTIPVKSVVFVIRTNKTIEEDDEVETFDRNGNKMIPRAVGNAVSTSPSGSSGSSPPTSTSFGSATATQAPATTLPVFGGNSTLTSSIGPFMSNASTSGFGTSGPNPASSSGFGALWQKSISNSAPATNLFACKYTPPPRLFAPPGSPTKSEQVKEYRQNLQQKGEICTYAAAGTMPSAIEHFQTVLPLLNIDVSFEELRQIDAEAGRFRLTLEHGVVHPLTRERQSAASDLFGQEKSTGSGGLFGTFTKNAAKSGDLFKSSGTPTNDTVTPGGLFGSSTEDVAKTGGLFGSTTGTGTTTSLFGSSDQTASVPSGGNLFGSNQATSTSSGGLFGTPIKGTAESGGLFGSSTKDTTKSGGLFGTPTKDTAQSGGLFGSTTGTSTTGGLFGGSNQNTPIPCGAGLFGPGPSSLNGGLFGTAAPSTGSGLFGSSQSSNSGGLFSTAPPSSTAGGLFGGVSTNSPFLNPQAPSSASGGSLFGASAARGESSMGASLFGRAPLAPAASSTASFFESTAVQSQPTSPPNLSDQGLLGNSQAQAPQHSDAHSQDTSVSLRPEAQSFSSPGLSGTISIGGGLVETPHDVVDASSSALFLKLSLFAGTEGAPTNQIVGEPFPTDNSSSAVASPTFHFTISPNRIGSSSNALPISSSMFSETTFPITNKSKHCALCLSNLENHTLTERMGTTCDKCANNRSTKCFFCKISQSKHENMGNETIKGKEKVQRDEMEVETVKAIKDSTGEGKNKEKGDKSGSGSDSDSSDGTVDACAS